MEEKNECAVEEASLELKQPGGGGVHCAGTQHASSAVVLRTYRYSRDMAVNGAVSFTKECFLRRLVDSSAQTLPVLI